MGLRIGQRQRRAPGAADHHPALEAEFVADHLHVRDQMRSGVVLARSLRAAAAAAALVEQHGVEARRDRTAGDDRAGSRCRGRHADRRPECRRAADGLDIELVAVADGEHVGGQRREGIGSCGRCGRVGVRRHAARSPACRRRNCGRGSGSVSPLGLALGLLEDASRAAATARRPDRCCRRRPVSAKAWQRQPPKSISRQLAALARLLHPAGAADSG